MIKTSDLDRNRNYLVGSHPHGVLSAGAFVCFGTDGLEFRLRYSAGLDMGVIHLWYVHVFSMEL